MNFDNISTEGIEELIYVFFKSIAEFDIKTLDFDWIPALVTFFAPIWNPIWEVVNEWLLTNFGF
ncbi:MAG: hypothetical protein E7547_06280 [Ruminococcaceae bacterium]|nr:hypothetical protein [Oscillospiraceae bacterium]